MNEVRVENLPTVETAAAAQAAGVMDRLGRSARRASFCLLLQSKGSRVQPINLLITLFRELVENIFYCEWELLTCHAE